MTFKNILPVVLFTGLLACNDSETSQNDLVETEIEVTDTTTESETDVEVEKIEEKTDTIDFSSFDDYATILNKTDLIAKFGKNNIEDKTAWYAEGTVERQSSILTNPNNGHIVKYVWAEEDNETTSWIEATYYKWGNDFGIEGKQDLGAKNGLKLGMSLSELVDWNGDHFEFSGFGWDYAGGVFPKEGSKLSKSNVTLRLIDDQSMQDEKWHFLLGDILFKTDDERLKDAPIIVEMFTIHIN